MRTKLPVQTTSNGVVNCKFQLIYGEDRIFAHFSKTTSRWIATKEDDLNAPVYAAAKRLKDLKAMLEGGSFGPGSQPVEMSTAVSGVTTEAIPVGKVREIEVSYKAGERGEKITAAEDAARIFRPFFEDIMTHKERFGILCLDQANQVQGYFRVSDGGMTACLVDVRIVFQAALKANAASIIVCHNHPSGNLRASEADERITRKLKKAGELLDISVLDHIILTEESYTTV